MGTVLLEWYLRWIFSIVPTKRSSFSTWFLSIRASILGVGKDTHYHNHRDHLTVKLQVLLAHENLRWLTCQKIFLVS